MIRILFAAVVMTAAPALAADCERYGATVTLTGLYAPAVLADNSDVPEREIARRTADLLMLDVPLCVSTDAVSAGVPAAGDVQLLCPEVVAGRGEALSVTGRLVGSHTGNGHTPVLLVCAASG